MPGGGGGAGGGGVERAVQFPQDGAALDDPHCARPRQHDGVQALGKSAAPSASPPSYLPRPGCRRACSTWCTAGSEAVEALCDHPDTRRSRSWARRTSPRRVRPAHHRLKRALCLGGAKNHLIVFPDADVERRPECGGVDGGVCGQRAGVGHHGGRGGGGAHDRPKGEGPPDVRWPGNVGPVIARQAKERIERYIAEAEQAGAKVSWMVAALSCRAARAASRSAPR